MIRLPAWSSHRGIALVVGMLVAGLVSVVGLALALLTTVGQLVARNHRADAVLIAAADAAIDIVADALATADWQAVLTGAVVAPQSDGAPFGVRVFGATRVDLDAETNRRNCRRVTPCSPADFAAISLQRPWGANNPSWRLFLYAPLAALGFTRVPPAYLLVWVADDPREADGHPEFDGGYESGRHVVLAHAVAIGLDSGRRSVDAEVVRVCLGEGAACAPGLRVQSQRAEVHAVP